ncbi:MAG TPA: hypothetical protein VHE83_02370 [Mycobacteriales bacterium]|nr:hypothetical protein [Mycobacteriales bacterium]
MLINTNYAAAPLAALWAVDAAANSHVVMTAGVSMVETFALADVAEKRQGDGPGSPPRGARPV